MRWVRDRQNKGAGGLFHSLAIPAIKWVKSELAVRPETVGDVLGPRLGERLFAKLQQDSLCPDSVEPLLQAGWNRHARSSNSPQAVDQHSPIARVQQSIQLHRQEML